LFVRVVTNCRTLTLQLLLSQGEKILKKDIYLADSCCSITVENFPQYPKVEGSSPSPVSEIRREKNVKNTDRRERPRVHLTYML
jgi:hypothetical protein